MYVHTKTRAGSGYVRLTEGVRVYGFRLCPWWLSSSPFGNGIGGGDSRRTEGKGVIITAPGGGQEVPDFNSPEFFASFPTTTDPGKYRVLMMETGGGRISARLDGSEWNSGHKRPRGEAKGAQMDKRAGAFALFLEGSARADVKTAFLTSIGVHAKDRDRVHMSPTLLAAQASLLEKPTSFPVSEYFPLLSLTVKLAIRAGSDRKARFLSSEALCILQYAHWTRKAPVLSRRDVPTKANIEQLHATQIQRMTRRIRELEQGLDEVYATISDEKHPLLRDEGMVASDHSTPPVSATPSPTLHDPSVYRDDINNYLGTLKSCPKGGSCFYGATASGEFLLKATRQKHDTTYFRRTRLSERVLSVPFPEASPELIAPEIRQMCWLTVISILTDEPHIGRTSSLTREELLHILETVYQNKCADPEPITHHLSLLFIVLALSRLLYGEDNYTVDSQDYFVLSRVALTLESPVTTTTVTAVQTIVYMAEYLVLSDVHIDPTGCARAWMYIGMAMKLAHSIGLHLGGARFRLEQREIKRRERVFWHLFSSEVWASFTSGRPPCTSLSFVDCDLPDDNEEQVGSDGDKLMGYHRWNYEFIKLLSRAMAIAFTSRPPPYAAILDLDRKLRVFYVPAHLRLQWTGQESSDNLLWIKRWVVLSNKEWALLNIHRAYFAQAIRENPLDPLRHRYGLSVMALYRSAFRLVEGCRKTCQACPPNFQFFRTNFASSKVLSVVIVMYLLVCSAPKSNLAMPALDVLNKAVALFETGNESGSIHLSENMEAVRNLHREAVEKVRSSGEQSYPPLRADELDRLSGMTRSRQASEAPTPVALEHLTTDYRAISGLDAPSASRHSSAESYAPPDPRLVEQVEMVSSGASAPNRAFPGEEDFGAGPAGQGLDAAGSASPQQPYILDASWQDFVAQLGF
ncbi:fungal-specific transcription factor domain-containing protein [Russula compacta]|nr:fungal-specific transcription factor domain-containing protein [Russula compacta]